MMINGIKKMLLTSMVALLGFGFFSGANANDKPEQPKVESSKQPSFSNQFSFTAGYSDYNVNGKRYASGKSLSIMDNGTFNLSKIIFISYGADYDYKMMDIKRITASLESSNIESFLEGSFLLYGSLGSSLSLGIGGETIINHKAFSSQDSSSYQERMSLGPKLGLSFKSDYFDASLSGSVLWGKRNADYDKSRAIMQEHASLGIILKSKNIRLPIEADFTHWALFGEKSDTQNNLFTVMARPELVITNSFSAVAKISYENKTSGDDIYSIFNAELGVKLQW